MNNLFADIGYQSLNKYGELICGDHVEMVEAEDGSKIIVLADGLGSGVKASILSTLTSKIISTMISEGISIVDCVSTIAATLPKCSTRGIAYSTFTIIHIIDDSEVEIIQYDNPTVILIREGKSYEYFKTELSIDGKRIFHSRLFLEEGDTFIAISDGCIHAGVGVKYNFGWERDNITKYLIPYIKADHTAKTLTKILLDKCYELYDGKPGDDTTSCIIRIRERRPVNLLVGPPYNPDDGKRMMSLFFAKEGKHIVCGGTTSKIAADYLGQRIIPEFNFSDPEIPPTAIIRGVDLVTEGIITINKVLEYAKDYLAENNTHEEWRHKEDGASMIAKILFEEATDISFYVGTAVNPAHQNPDLPINFTIKMQLVKELSVCLKEMGKRINTSYF